MLRRFSGVLPILAVGLALIAASVSCGGHTDVVPGYALFRDSEGIGEVGNGVVGQGLVGQRGTWRSEFYFFAPAAPIYRAMPQVRSRYEHDGWTVRVLPEAGHAGLFEARSSDGKTCVRYLSLEGDYRERIRHDRTLSHLGPDGVDGEVRYGAVLTVIVERNCDDIWH